MVTTSVHTERLKYIIAVMLYGTIGMILRFIRFPSELVVLCRGGIGCLFLLATQLLSGKKPDGKAIWVNGRWLVLSGICLGLNWVFLFAAYIHTTVAVASLCNYMASIVLIFLSPLLFREKLTGKKLLCVLAACIGIVLVSGVLGQRQGVNFRGVALGLAAAVCFVGIVLCNKMLRNIRPMERCIVQLGVSSLVVLPYVVYRNWGTPIPVDLRSVLLTAMLGIVHTGLAYRLYFSAMGNLPVQTISILGYIEPVMSILCSAIVLGEPLGIAGIVGAVLIIGAAAVSERL